MSRRGMQLRKHPDQPGRLRFAVSMTRPGLSSLKERILNGSGQTASKSASYGAPDAGMLDMSDLLAAVASTAGDR